MSSLNPNLLSDNLTRIMNTTVDIMKRQRQRNITPEMALLAMLQDPDHPAYSALQRIAEERGTDLDALERQTWLAMETRRDTNGDLDYLTGEGRAATLSRQMLIALDEGLSVAQSMDEVYIDTDHLLMALTERALGTGPLLEQHGVTPSALRGTFSGRYAATVPAATPDEAARGSNTTEEWVSEAKAGRLRAVYFREDLLRELMNMVSMTRARHVVLLGPDGVGKRTLAYSFALLLAEGRGPAGLDKVVQVREEAFLDRSIESMQIGIKRAVGGLLFVPHLARFFGQRAPYPQAGRNLQKALLGDDPVVLATATPQEWEMQLSQIPALREQVQTLHIPAPSTEETVEMLRVVSPHIAADYQLAIADDALLTAADLAARYMQNTPLPRSAEHLLHRSAALVSVSRQGDVAFKHDVPDEVLDAEDVMLAASQLTGVPVSKLGQDERTRYASMVQHLQERIIGQQSAVMAVSRAVKIARVGLRSPKRPIGSFLFLGPSGVGKTELAKALAEFMFGTEDAMLQIDMSEYMSDASISRLIGAPPGYIGFEGGGMLTERVRQQPYIVVLFDEVEKAHPRVLDLLLQVMEEGRLTDSQGQVANFSEAVIILTSNLGAAHLTERSISPEIEASVMEEVNDFLRPEFINRLDDVIMFHPLSPADLLKILGLMLRTEQALAGQNGLDIRFSEAARLWMVAQNDEPQFGARPLRRIIQRYVREPLADFILQNNPDTAQTIHIDAPQEGQTGLHFS